MKAVVLKEPNRLEIAEAPIPKVESDYLLIKVELCGLCGTDLLVYDGRFPVEMPYFNLGHEYTGVVVKTGSEVKTISVGQRVTIDPNYHCSLCYFCRRGDIEFCENRRRFKKKSNGGLAEYVVITEKLVYKIPANLSPEEAIFAEPLSCCLHGLALVNIEPGADVLIFGAGTIGLLTLQLCKLRGARRIVVSEPVGLRRKIAEELGADVVIDPLKRDLKERIKEVFPKGPDLTIESAGAKETLGVALNLIKNKGQVLLMAIWPRKEEIAMKPFLIVEKEVSLRGVLFGSGYLGRAIEVLEKRLVNVKPLLTHRYRLVEIGEAMEKAKSREAIKVAINLVSEEE